jgi:hypothetical protein
VQYAYTPEGLAGQSIVLTTYDTLRAHGQLLKRVHWHRVVVDECQELRVGTSQVCGWLVGWSVGRLVGWSVRVRSSVQRPIDHFI